MLAIVACGDATSPSGEGLRTDASSYTATSLGSGQFGVRLVLSYQNYADTAISLDRCLPTDTSPMYSVELEWPVSAEGAAYNGAWACVGGVTPIVVASGATRVDTITLRGPLAYEHDTQQPLGVLAGKFRIGYGAKLSNAFQIKLPPT
jgi:hypothetical protein